MPTRNSAVLAGAAFLADPLHVRRSTGRQVDWAAVPEDYRDAPGQSVIAGAASAGATTLPVTALARPLKAGTTLVFDPAAGEYATVSADAAAGATSVSVNALASALEGGETAVVTGTGAKRLKAGTVVAQNTTTGKLVPRGAGGAAPAGTATFGLLETDANELALHESASGYGVIKGGHVFENLLPDATGSPKALPSAVKTELNAAGVGSFTFEQYNDNSNL